MKYLPVLLVLVGCASPPQPTREDPICPALREREALFVKHGISSGVDLMRRDMKKYGCSP